MSNHIDRAYISQWYGANGVRPQRGAGLHGRGGGPGGQPAGPARPCPRAGTGASRASPIVPKRSVPALKIDGPERAPGEQADVGEVVGVDELVAVRAVAEHDRVGAVGDPVEEDAEDAQAAVAEDGAGADDRDVEAVGGGSQAGPLGGQLGLRRRPPGAWGRSSGSTGLASGTPNTALDDVCTTFDTPASALAAEQEGRAVDVDRPEQLGVPGQRHLGHVVVHDVDAVDRLADPALGRGCRPARTRRPDRPHRRRRCPAPARRRRAPAGARRAGARSSRCPR